MKIAQFSDSHLLAEPSSLHHGANVFHNLLNVLIDISNNAMIDAAVFTGDLTQDHSEESYLQFVRAVTQSGVKIPLYYLSGNHDEPELLDRFLSIPPLNADKKIESEHWQICLINSKSETPSGYVDDASIATLNTLASANKHVLVMMHHHPIDVGYFIDHHGLKNKNKFWQTVNHVENIQGIACGHVHNGLMLSKTISRGKIPLFTCPATSIEFDTNSTSVVATEQGPGYRIFDLLPNGNINSQLVYLT